MDLTHIDVIKYSGEKEKFKPDNLRNSLKSAGATDEEVQSVYSEIQKNIYDGISTRELYDLAFTHLKTIRESYAARYSLKKALRELGPEGFYFEKWIAKIFAEDGSNTITGQTVQGKAVTHEIDVIMDKDNKRWAIECKFRNDAESKISVTTPMYFLSRLNDIKGKTTKHFNQGHAIDDGMLVTNAYFTSDSTAFAEYYHINLLSWNYPSGKSLKNLVDLKGQYPITCLTTLSTDHKQILLKSAQCILVKELVKHPEVLQKINIDEVQQEKILKEANELIDNKLE